MATGHTSSMLTRKKSNNIFEDAEEPQMEPKPGTGRKPGRRSRNDLEKQLEEQFHVMLQASALIWSTRDHDTCPMVLHENSASLAKAFAHSAARSRYGSKIALSISEASVWVPAAQACANIGMTIYANHFSPEAREAKESEVPGYDDPGHYGDSTGHLG